MKLYIKEIETKDFKKGLPLKFKFTNKQNLLIGANGSGKTTILDAIFWVLFGKNHSDKKKFSAFPLDENNNVIQGKNPEVTLTIVRGSETNIIKRWYKKDTMNMSIDDMPYKAREFERWITDSISTETAFKMFINPLFITEELTPKQQRELFLTFFEMPKREIVLDQLKKDKVKVSKKLLELLNKGNSGEKILNWAEMKRKELKSSITFENGKIELLAEQVADFDTSVSKTELTTKRDRIELEVKQYRQAMKKEAEKDRVRTELNNKIHSVESQISDFMVSVKNRIKYEIQRINQEVQLKESEKENLAEIYKAKTKTEFKIICPTCKQNIPKTNINMAKERLRIELAKIAEKGKTLKEEITKLNAKIEKLKKAKSLPSDKKELKALQDTLKKAKADFDKAPEPIIVKPINALTDELTELNQKLLQFDNLKKLKIEKGEHIKLASSSSSQLETVEEVEISCKAYENMKAKIIVDKVNSNFDTIKINLFEQLKNGSYRDTFIVTKNGVPYNDINKAGRLEASIEISRFVAKKQNLEFPIIIDDFGRYTDVEIKEDTQLILCKAVKQAKLHLETKKGEK